MISPEAKDQLKQIHKWLVVLDPKITLERIIERAIERHYHRHKERHDRRTIVQVQGSSLRKAQNCLCHYCGKYMFHRDTTVDHKVPYSRGGTHDRSNLVACHNKCNNMKSDMTEEEYREFLNETARSTETIQTPRSEN